MIKRPKKGPKKALKALIKVFYPYNPFQGLYPFWDAYWVYSLASLSHYWSVPLRRSYISLAETRQIVIIITMHISLLRTGLSWVTIFGTPLMPSKSSNPDLLRFSMVCPWLWIESDSGSLRSSTPLLKAGCIYRHWLKAIEMELA